MDEERTPQEQVKDAIWQYTGWAMIIAVCIGAGVFIGYTLWGDAMDLRIDVERLEKQVSEFKNNRESLQTQIAMLSRDRDECRRAAEAAAAGEAGAAPGGPAAGGAAPGGPETGAAGAAPGQP